MTFIPTRHVAATAALLLGGLSAGHTQTINNNLDGSLGLATGWSGHHGDVAVVSSLPDGVTFTGPTLVLGTASLAYEDDAGHAPGAFNVSQQTEPMFDTDLGVTEADLALPSGTLGPDTYEGSSLLGVVNLQAGDTLSFRWRVLTRTPEAALASENDSIWFLSPDHPGTGALTATLQSLMGSNIVHTNGWLDSGWLTYSWTSPTAQSTSLAWGVFDVGSTTDTTVLAVQGLAVTPAVPEPANWTLALGALALLGTQLRRRATR